MSHANAALTPRARLRLARLIVERGLAGRPGGGAVSTCPGRPRRGGPPGTGRPGRRAWLTGRRVRTGARRRTPAPMVRRDRASAVAAAAGAGRDRRPAGGAGLDGARGAGPLPAATGSRTSTGATGEPIRRYEHDQPGALLHVDVKKLGNIPDGGGWRYVGRARASATARHRRQAPQPAPPPAHRHRVRAHRHRRPLPPRLRRDPRRRDRRHRRRGSAPRRGLVRRPRHDRIQRVPDRHSNWVVSLGCSCRPAGGVRISGSGARPSSLLDRSERAATSCLLITGRAGPPPGGGALLGTR